MLSLKNSNNIAIPPEKPIKKWRELFEAKNLDHKDLVQYYQICAPYFINIDQKDSLSEVLGKQPKLYIVYAIFVFIEPNLIVKHF